MNPPGLRLIGFHKNTCDFLMNTLTFDFDALLFLIPNETS